MAAQGIFHVPAFHDLTVSDPQDVGGQIVDALARSIVPFKATEKACRHTRLAYHPITDDCLLQDVHSPVGKSISERVTRRRQTGNVELVPRR